MKELSSLCKPTRMQMGILLKILWKNIKFNGLQSIEELCLKVIKNSINNLKSRQSLILVKIKGDEIIKRKKKSKRSQSRSMISNRSMKIT
jgi:hypothetical protein